MNANNCYELVKKGAAFCHHLGHSLLQLGSLLHKINDLLIQLVPVLRLEAKLDYGDKNPSSAVGICTN